jgi:antitoxin component HigA of HigAB toxin-antitoxin module
MTLNTEIKTEEEYRKSLARIEELFDIPDDSPDRPELIRLLDLVNAYEDIHYPMGNAANAEPSPLVKA